MKTLLILFSAFIFSSLSAQDIVISKELNDRLEDVFSESYRLNRASKNETGYYIEVISQKKLFVVNIDRKGNITDNKIAFTFSEDVYKQLSERCSAFKLEDIRKGETQTQLELICNDKRVAYNISKEGNVTELK